MNPFRVENTSIEGLLQIYPQYAEDGRGYVSKIFDASVFKAHGIALSPSEELRSFSKKGVLRGLHLQWKNSQDKLVHVLFGAVYDVAVDLRAGSSTFGKWEGFSLTGENRRMLYLPKGFAHGFLALGEENLLGYLIGGPYDPESDGGIRWNDPQLAIDWPLYQIGEPVISERDRALPGFEAFIDAHGALFQEVEL